MKKIPVTENQTERRTVTQAAAAAPAASSASADNRSADEDDPMAGLQADLDRFRDLAMRSQADFENYKKRCAREKEDAIKYANSSLLERLLPVVDNFELGLSAAREEGERSAVYSGMSLVLKQINDFLSDNGLQPIEAVGAKFDPNLHDAIAHEPSNTIPENHVIRQTRRGYRFKDRLLRPSSVVVSSGPSQK
jgi:molecular chaperone GrpE